MKKLLIIIIAVMLAGCDFEPAPDWLTAYHDYLDRERVEYMPTRAKNCGKDILAIHRETLTRFTHMPDLVQYGVVEYWAIFRDGPIVGDCEDYALSLHHRLLQEGVPAHLVITERGGSAHMAVLTCGLMLDNNDPDGIKGPINYITDTIYIDSGWVRL